MKTIPDSNLKLFIFLALLYLVFVGAESSWGLNLESGESVIPTGTDTGLLAPSGLLYDLQRERLLIADTENNRILLVNSQGDVSKKLGLKGELYLPVAMAVTRSGTLFIAERSKSVLKVLFSYSDQAQDEYQLFDLGAYAKSRPVQPVALFVDEEDALYVCDRGNRQLLVFNRDRSLRMVVPKVGEPADVWVQGGKIYIADPGFGGVRIYNQKGRWERTLGDSTSQFPSPLRVRAIAADRLDRLWVLEESGTIRALDSLGAPLLSRHPQEMFVPVDLVLDNHKNLYVLDRAGNRITRFQINEF